MNLRPALHLALACALAFTATGCNAPGKPSLAAEAETQRPEQLLDPATLYKQNCAACHGDQGRNGASISLANPTYLAIAGVANLQRITAAGVPGTLMPGFSKAAGGMLTDQQIAALARGIVQAWGQPLDLGGQTPPAYAATTPGDPAQGQKTFTAFCARCHGADGAGNPPRTGSLVDPAYLALVSDQSLRSAILAGRPENHMPDWRGYGPTPLTGQQIADTVAWLASHRIATPGQPYRQRP